MGQVI